MSCNGCRILRKGCSDSCVLRPCLQWIPTAEAQGNATLFVAKFFGRADLMSFISSVPQTQRPALFRSLLFEACGRTVNPVNGAVGLLWTGNWYVCQKAVETVLAGGCLQPIPSASAEFSFPVSETSSDDYCTEPLKFSPPNGFNKLTGEGLDDLGLALISSKFTVQNGKSYQSDNRRLETSWPSTEESEASCFGSRFNDYGGTDLKLLKLFV